jgi:hypothetical protein
LRGGTYNPSGNLDIPAGMASQPITIANYGGEPARITGPVVFGKGHVLMEGLTLDAAEESGWTILIESRSSAARSNIELKNLDVLGGRIEAIRLRGNVRNVTIRNSLLDGGRDNHVVKLICDNPGRCGAGRTPEDIVVTNNHFSKVRAAFFPRPGHDEAEGGSGDLIQLEGAGNVTITRNLFESSDYEDCVDVKRQGRAGSSLVISRNVIDSRGASGCRGEGILVIQGELAGTTTIEGNRFVGGHNLIRATHSGTRMINNVLDGAALTVAGASTTMTLGHNTFMNSGNGLTFGDSAGRPGGLTVINNIFSRTAFRGTRGDYHPVRNVLFQTTGSTLGSCAGCVTGNPALSGYEIQPGSSALDAANPQFTVATDIQETGRPQGPGHDIGAHELASSSAPPAPPSDPTEFRVEAEDYDAGGEGVAFHDRTAVNSGGAYRNDGVDIKPNTYGGFTVGWMQHGEWLKYTINVAQTCEYRVTANVGTIQTDRPSFTVSLDGVVISTVRVPNTGSWDVKQLVDLPSVSLTQGTHVLRVDVNQQWLDIDYIDFACPAA